MLRDGHSQKDIAAHFGVTPAAISKRLKRLVPDEPECMANLSDKEKKFVLEKAAGKTQTQAALASFECGSLASAKAIGHQLMAKNDIKIAVAELMQDEGLTRRFRVQKLKQHVENRDPNISLKALDQSWKLDGAYIDTRRHVIYDYNEICSSLEEVENEIAQLEGKKVERSSGEESIDAEIAALESELD